MSLGTSFEKNESTVTLCDPVVEIIPKTITNVQIVSGAFSIGKPNVKMRDRKRNEVPMQHPRCQLSLALISMGTMKHVPKRAKRIKF